MSSCLVSDIMQRVNVLIVIMLSAVAPNISFPFSFKIETQFKNLLSYDFLGF